MIVEITVVVLISFTLSLIFNRFLISFAGKLGLMDLPDERRVHVKPIPRAGGLAIWLAFVTASFLLVWQRPDILAELKTGWLIPFTLASTILVVVGVFDDRGGVKPWWKLLGQAAAAATFFLLLPNSHDSLFGLSFPYWLDALIFIGWSVLLINSFNLIDGLDGLCGGLALIALCALSGVAAVNGHMGAMTVMLIMAAALTGFLKFNWHPAKIFLGDTGSMLLGFFIAASATQTVGRRAIVGALLLPIAVAGVPLLDVMLAVWRRSIRKVLNSWSGEEKVAVFGPDKDHLHHRLLAVGGGQRRVTRIMHGLAVILSILAFLPMLFGDKLLGVTVVGLLVLALLGLRSIAKIELVHSGEILHLAVKRPSGNLSIRVMMFVYDCIIFTGAALIAYWIDDRAFSRGFEVVTALQFAVAFTLLQLSAMYSSKAYRRSWSRASLRDFSVVLLAIGMAGVITITVVSFVRLDLAYSVVGKGALATLIAMAAVMIPRLSVELIRELAVDAAHRGFDKKNKNTKNVVVYGGGDLGNLFVEYLKTCPPADFRNFRVCGFLDDNPRLSGRVLRGFPVFGGLNELESLSEIHDIHGVIVAISRPDPTHLAELRELAGKCKVVIYDWCHDLSPRPMLEAVTLEEPKKAEVV